MPETLGEFARIDRYFKPLAAGLDGALGLTDDAGLVAVPPGEVLVATADTMVAGVHFLAEDDPADLGRKLLRVNLSDLAGMGARPHAYLLTTALPSEIGEDWLAAFAAGLGRDQHEFGIGLLGGDSVRSPGPVVLTVTALGFVAAGQALRRSGAQPGDRIYVSGTLGDGALGLLAARGELNGRLADEHVAALAARYHLPRPRLALGQGLTGLAHAAMDISDGLPGDLGHICTESRVAARVDADRVPLSAAGRAAVAAAPALWPVALAGGDDYELLFTAPPAAEAAVAALGARLGLGLTVIGEIVDGAGVTVLDAAGRPVEGLRGWAHF